MDSMRLYYTLCIILCLLTFTTVNAQNTYDTPCDAFTTPWTGWGATTTTQVESGDLTGMTPFNTDLAMPQDFGCAGSENAVFAKLNFDYNTSRVEFELTGGTANNVSIALFGVVDPQCGGGTAFMESVYQDPAGMDMVQCNMVTNNTYEFDLCNFTTTEFDNLYLWISSPSADEGTFTMNVTQVVAPPNDDCATAEAMGTLNVGAQLCRTGETNVNACPGPSYTGACYTEFSTGSTVWYTFTTGANVENIRVEVDHSLNDLTYALIELPGGCGAPRENVVNATIDGDYCGALTGGLDMLEQLPVRENTSYYLIVNTPAAEAGNFDICVEAHAPVPPNDKICNADVASFDPDPNNTVTLSGTTVNGSIFWTDPSTKTWENFDCPSPAPAANPYSATFYKLDIDPYATRIQISGSNFSGSGNLSGQIFIFDDESDCPAYPHVTLMTPAQASAGDCNILSNQLQLDLCGFTADFDDLYLYVSSERTDQGTFDIDFQQEIAPVNDMCDDPSDPARGAEDLGTITLGNEECATELTNRGACPGPAYSDPCLSGFQNEATVWYTFQTGNDVTMITAEVEHTNMSGVRLSLFELPAGCGDVPTFYPGPAMTDEYCADDTDGDGIDSVWNLPVRENQTYYLIVSTDSTAWGDFNSICVRNCAPPANDKPCNAEVVNFNIDPNTAEPISGTTKCANPLYADDDLTVVNWNDGCTENESTVYYELNVDDYASYVKIFGSSVDPTIPLSGRIVTMTDPCNPAALYGGTPFSTQPEACKNDLNVAGEFLKLDLCGLTIADKQNLYLEISSPRLDQVDFDLNFYQEIAPVNDMCDDPSAPGRGAEDLGTIAVGNESCATELTNRGACVGPAYTDACLTGFQNEATVWYTFQTGTDVTMITAEVDHTNMSEVRLSVFELPGGCGTTPTFYTGPAMLDEYCAEDTDGDGIDSVWNIPVRQNQTYYLAVSTDSTAWGDFNSVCVSNCAAPANDKPCNAEVVTFNTDPTTPQPVSGTTKCANPLYADDDLSVVNWADGCTENESTVYYELNVDDYATYVKIFGSSADPTIPLSGRIVTMTDPCNPAALYGGSPFNTQPEACKNDLNVSGEFLKLDLCGLTIAEKQDLYLEISSPRLDQVDFDLNFYQEIAPDNDQCDDPSSASRQAEDLGTIDSGVEACRIAETNRGACPDAISTDACFADFENEATVWYRFSTGTNVELLSIDVSHSNGQEVRLGLFQLGTTGNCADPVQAIPAVDYPVDYCVSNTSNGVDSVWKVLVQQNTDYFVAVSTDTSTWGEFDICVKNCTPPGNDRLCDVANDMSYHIVPGEEDESSRNSVIVPGTTVCANHFFSDFNLTTFDMTCPVNESGVFYKIDVDENATEVTITANNIDGINTLSGVLFVPQNGACPAAPRDFGPAIWQDAMMTPMTACDLGSGEIKFDLCAASIEQKDSIWLWVGTERKDQGRFELEVSQKVGPENDNCDRTVMLDGNTPSGPQCITGTNLFGCPDNINLTQPPLVGDEMCEVDSPGMMDFAGVWYEFHTDATGELLDVTLSHTNGAEVHVALYAKNPDCENLLPVACEQDNDDGIIDHIQDYGLNPDTTYLLYVYTSKANWGEFELCYDIKEIPPCDGDPPRYFNHTTPICGLDVLDNFCIDMTAGDYPLSGQSWPGCSSWGLHNPNWFSFIAGAENLEISIDITNCNNNAGAQVAMYELPCDQEFDPGQPGIDPTTIGDDLVSDCVYAACNQGNVTFQAITEVGQLYGIVFDGCNGDVCHIEIDITVGGDPPELDDDILDEPTFPDEDLGFNQDTICWGAEDVPFAISQEVPGACRYIWTLNGDSIEDATNMTTELIDFDDPLMPGLHEVCVSASNYCDTTDPVCIEVLVVALDPYYTVDTICEGDSYTWIGPFGEVLGNFGPFDGVTGPQNYTETTMNAYSCEVPAELDLYVRNENDENPSPIDTFICFSDLPYSIFDVDIGGPVNDFEVQTISPVTGCDTFFAVDLTVFGGNFFVSANCDGMGNMIFSIDLMEDPQSYTNWFDQFQIFDNNPDFSYEIEWTAAGMGGVLDSTEDLTLSQQEIEDLAIGDIMTLRLQLKMYYKGELFCDPISPPYEFFLSHNFPEILNITGDTTYCPGQQNLKLYSATQDPIAPVGGLDDPVTFFQWYPPNGFTIDPPYTSTTDTISLTSPSMPDDNTVCLTVTTGSCMFTDSLCIELLEQTPDQPILEPDNQTCDTTWTFSPSFASSGGWSIIDTPASGNTAYFEGATNNPNATVNVKEPGVYTFEWREGPTDCALYDTVTIEFLENPESVSYVDTCYFGVNFVVEIDFDGGTPGYSIDPASTITGDLDPTTGVFISDTIVIDFDPVDGNYGDELQLIITDANGCVSDTVDILLVCECESEIGDMSSDLIELCEGDVASAVYQGGHENDGDDTLMYVLHRGDTTELIGILDTSLIGEFTFDPTNMTHGTTYYISRVIGNAVGQYVDLDDPCLDVAEGQPVVWHEVPVADPGPDTTLCGFSYTLNANPSVGTGLWKVVPSNPRVDIDDPSSPNTLVDVDDAGTYTFRWIETNEICQDSAEVNVTLTGEIIPITSTICNALATEYDIKIILSGGGGDYFIEDFVDSALTDSLYMVGDTIFATNIPKDSVVTFTINNALGCGPVVLPVTTACVCETVVGTLEDQVLQACSDGCIDATVLDYDTTGQYLDPNDSLSYVMHTSSDDTLLSSNFIIQRSSGIFCYADVMNNVAFGDTVYISVIAGNHIGGGRVDINDPCQQITFGARAVFSERPVAEAGPDQDVCGLDGSLSAVASVGGGNWSYVSGPSANVSFGNANSASTSVTADDFGTHVFAWTEDNHSCEDSDTVELTFLTFPDATNISFDCDDIASSYVVTFEIENGDTSSYMVTGSAGTLNDNIFISDPIPHDSTYTFYVFDGNQCDTTIVTGSHFCPCITEIGSLTGPSLDLCRNTGVSGVSYDNSGEVRDANDGLIYVLLDASENVIASGSSPNFFFNPGTMNLGETYYIRVYLGSVIGGDFQFDERCTLSDGDVAVTWYGFPEAIAEPAFDTLTCDLTSVNIDGSNSVGVGNGLEFSWSGGNIEGPTDGSSITAASPGDYTLTVTDTLSGCTDEVTVTIERSADIPIAEAEAVPPAVLTCDVNEVTIDGSGSSSGPNIIYEWTASTGNIVGPTNGNTIVVDEPGSYILTVTDTSNNCSSTAVPVEILVDREPPVAQASVSDQLSCSITEVDLIGSGSSTGNDFEYQWSTTPPGNITGNTMTLSTKANSVGDYTLVVTNTDNGCIDSVTVSVTENTNALTGIDVDFNNPRCHNDVNGSISITPTGGQEPITYTLKGAVEDQNNNGTFTNLGPGTYVIEVSDVNGCFESDTVTMVNPPLLSIGLPESIIIEEGDTVVIEAILPPGAIYDTLVWDTDTVPYICLDSACTLIQMTPLNTVEVNAQVVGGVGCSDEDAMKIIVKVVRDVYIPNVFTPNGDGINDVFLPATGRRVVSINNMMIFDRWGTLIYESRSFQPGDESFGWDGTFKGDELRPAVFVYKVEVEYDNGDVDIINGTVTLSR